MSPTAPKRTNAKPRSGEERAETWLDRLEKQVERERASLPQWLLDGIQREREEYEQRLCEIESARRHW